MAFINRLFLSNSYIRYVSNVVYWMRYKLYRINDNKLDWYFKLWISRAIINPGTQTVPVIDKHENCQLIIWIYRICARYQQCTRCVQTDEAGQLVDIGGIEDVECNWENGRYEISFQAGSDRVFCDLNKNDCGVNLCKVNIEHLEPHLLKYFEIFSCI